jgi:putative exporter of polyketide antibiotics
MHWYGWVSLIFCAWSAVDLTVRLVGDALDQNYRSGRVLYVALWWTLTLAILIVGATP